MTLPVELEKSEVAKVSKTKLAVSEGIPYITQKTGERYYKYGIHITTSDPTFTWKRSTVYRRYSEFCWLRKNLKDTSYMFLATVPDLPGQGLFRNRNDLKFIEERRFGLEKFLLQVLSVNVFTSNRGLHLFLQTSLSIEDIKYNMKGSRHDHVILIKKCIPVLDKSQSESVAVSLENESVTDEQKEEEDISSSLLSASSLMTPSPVLSASSLMTPSPLLSSSLLSSSLLSSLSSLSSSLKPITSSPSPTYISILKPVSCFEETLGKRTRRVTFNQYVRVLSISSAIPVHMLEED